MAKKGQAFQTYSFELKKEAIEMRLQGHGVRVNHKKVLRLMQEMKIRSTIRRKWRKTFVNRRRFLKS